MFPKTATPALTLTLVLLSFGLICETRSDFLLHEIQQEIFAEEEISSEGFCSASGGPQGSSCGSHAPGFTKVKMASKDHRERSFIMVKPDGVQRGLVGDIIKRFEQKGFKLVALKFKWADDGLLKKHYAVHAEQPFFPKLIQYIGSGPVVAMVWEGIEVIKTARQMLGATNPSTAAQGTIRGDYCIEMGRNAIHGSDSLDSANYEIALWFKDEELVTWKSNQDPWIYE